MEPTRIRLLEGRALLIGMWGNLFMAGAGIVTAFLSHSTAIMMDGLFSLIGFAAAFLGRRISRRLGKGPDRLRPMGYAADEAIFLTFRALSLIGLVIFAAASAGMNIFDHVTGEPVPRLNFGPIFVYFTMIFATCALLWATHYLTWRWTGKVSEVLRLEAKASIFDTIITAAAGAGMVGVYFLRDSFLAPLTPVGDSIIVLILCATIIGQYRRDLLAGLGELAGVTASPRVISAARRAIRPSVAEAGGTLTDLSVMKLGRSHFLNVYYNPGRAVEPAELDALNLRMIHDARAALPGADVLLIVTEHPRRWPPHLDPG